MPIGMGRSGIIIAVAIGASRCRHQVRLTLWRSTKLRLRPLPKKMRLNCAGNRELFLGS
jgi:hypothetical protein